MMKREIWAIAASWLFARRATISGGFTLALHRWRCCALVLVSLWFMPTPSRATSYELEGKVAVVYPNRPDLTRNLTYTFRRNGPRWQLDVRGNTLLRPYEVTSLACTGKEMIQFFKNFVPSEGTAPTTAAASQKPPATLVPFQAEVRPGVQFPKYSNMLFGQILAALAPDLLEDNLQRNACRLVYPNTNALARCYQAYTVTRDPDGLGVTRFGLTTDGKVLLPDGTVISREGPHANGYEVLVLESRHAPDDPANVHSFNLRYQYPFSDSEAAATLDVVWRMHGQTTAYRTNILGFTGWPAIQGKTMVYDFRVPLGSPIENVIYVTTNKWLQPDDADFQELLGAYGTNAVSNEARMRTARRIWLFSCILIVLVCAIMAAKKTALRKRTLGSQ